jgi:hypothetical protein
MRLILKTDAADFPHGKALELLLSRYQDFSIIPVDVKDIFTRENKKYVDFMKEKYDNI